MKYLILALLLSPLTLLAEPKLGDVVIVDGCKGRIIKIYKDYPEDPDNFYLVKFLKCGFILKMNINDIEGYIPESETN